MKEYFQPSFSKESINATIKTWQPHSKEPLTEKDAVEILTGVFGLLNWLANTEDGQKIMEQRGSQDSSAVQ